MLLPLYCSDRFRTMINVLGDALAAGIIGHLCRKDFPHDAEVRMHLHSIGPNHHNKCILYSQCHSGHFRKTNKNSLHKFTFALVELKRLVVVLVWPKQQPFTIVCFEKQPFNRLFYMCRHLTHVHIYINIYINFIKQLAVPVALQEFTDSFYF